MTAPEYATPADLAAGDWLDADTAAAATDADIARALRSACKAVREATVTWFYTPDQTTGLPLDATILEPMKTATLEQAAALIALEVDTQTGGTLDSAIESSAAIGSARVTIAGAEQAAAARAAAITGLCLEARRTLRLAVMNHVVTVWG